MQSTEHGRALSPTLLGRIRVSWSRPRQLAHSGKSTNQPQVLHQRSCKAGALRKVGLGACAREKRKKKKGHAVHRESWGELGRLRLLCFVIVRKGKQRRELVKGGIRQQRRERERGLIDYLHATLTS